MVKSTSYGRDYIKIFLAQRLAEKIEKLGNLEELPGVHLMWILVMEQIDDRLL